MDESVKVFYIIMKVMFMYYKELEWEKSIVGSSSLITLCSYS